MLNWIEISSHDDIPGRDENGRQRNFLAIHHTKNYTSDVYMVWKNMDGEVPRWPHNGVKNITHIAEFNLPTSIGGTYQSFLKQIDSLWAKEEKIEAELAKLGNCEGVSVLGNATMRRGQVVMNTLAKVWPEKYKEVSGSVLDCFYNDSAVENLMIHLSNQDWDEKKIHRPYMRAIREIVDRGRWDQVCETKGINPWSLNEGSASYEGILAFSILELNKLKLD